MTSTTIKETSKPTVDFNQTAHAFAHRSSFELLKMEVLFASIQYPWVVKWGTSIVNTVFKWRLPFRFIIKNTLFDHFCGGINIKDCESTIESLHASHVGTILDYSVEGEDTEEAFEATVKELLETIEKAAQHPEAIPFTVFKVTGIGSFDILEAVQSGEELSLAQVEAFEKVKKRVQTLCEKAASLQVRIFIDAEDSWIQQTIDDLAYAMMKLYNKNQPIVYNTFQLYRVGMLDNLKRAFHYAAMENYWLGAKLVRGAYMEKERARAAEMGYPDPIQPNKAATDRDFDEALRFCIDNKQRIAVCAGTHNEQSSLYLTKLMEKYNVKHDDKNVFFAQLYGMSDNITYNLAKQGYNVAKYVPYGPVEATLPYLFRRAEENTSVAGQTSRELSLIRSEKRRRKSIR